MKRHLLLAALVAWSMLSTAAAQVTGKAPWEEFEKRIDKSRAIGALGPGLFGDDVSLADGSLSFTATDVDLPGNDGLRVAFARKYTVYNHWQYPETGSVLADWDLDVPSISGIFAPNWTIGPSASGNRCSLTGGPTEPARDYYMNDFWHGNTLSIPGVGGGELLQLSASAPRPATGGPYVWTTADGIRISCLSGAQGVQDGSEGFLATTPDGTRYWFNRMAQYHEPRLEMVGRRTLDGFLDPNPVTRRKNVLYATRVEDRFGNSVSYTYTNAWDGPATLTAITASDGRRIDITYDSGRVSTVKANGRTWSYTYGTTPSGYRTLTAVTLPDTRQWAIGLGPLTDAYIKYPVGSFQEPARTCMSLMQPPVNELDEPVGTITHPSGAVGTFRVGIRTHGRSNVPIACRNVVTNGTGPGGGGNDPNDDINMVAISYEGLSLLQKTIAAPTIPLQAWDYDYASDISWRMPPGGSIMWPVCYPWSSSCLAPDCLSDSCAGSARTTITGPGGSWVRYTYGNSYNYNEGKLLKVERGSDDTHILRTETNAYDLSLVDQAYPARAGDSARGSHEGFATEYTRPLLRKDIAQQGATFTWQAATGCGSGSHCFDQFARPTKVVKSSTLGYSRTEATAYSDNLTKWVLGQIASVTCTAPASCAGIVESKTEYDPGSALPLRMYGPGTAQTPGPLRQTLTYRADGTIATVKDGNNNTITVSNWKRGIPQLIQYPATPDQPSGASESAVVDNNGWITSTADENGYTTGYGYDAMGRLASINYPTGDSVAWASTLLAFAPASLAAYGLPAGHWQQTVHTGNGYKVIHFDALWRPVVEESYDSGNAGSTRSIVVKRYDTAGRLAFQSYPLRTLANYLDPALKGVRTEYDALDRVTAVKQDSEIGLLATTTQYQPGFKTEVQNPRQQGTGVKTTTAYQVWDTPTTDYPVAIAAPEGSYTDIVRDAFGKPLSLKRRNAGDSMAITRSFVYNAAQELCKTIEPETASTLMVYDNAGNLAWTASGQDAPSTGSCDTAPVAERTTRSYDARNRVKALVFPDNRGNTTYTYTPDGLLASIQTSDAGADVVTTTYAYNKRRLPTQEVLQVGAFNWPLGYAYNVNGALASHTYPDGLVVDYAPNALGQATKAKTYATGVSYFPNGGMSGFTYGNGIVHSMQQNLRQLPDTSTDAYGGTKVLSDSYDYDGNGNVAAITDGATGTGQRGNRTMTYDYLDRLKSTTSPMFAGGTSYSYDVLDNLVRVKAPGRDHTYVYDSKWRLTNVTNTTGGATVIGLSYDAQGNLGNKNGQLFDFDRGNRLREAVNKEHYVYDGHGRRVQAAHATGNIYSMYGQDGVLRYQRDERKGEAIDYVMLNGSLVARVKNTVAPPVPALTAPGYVTTGSYTVSWTAVNSATRYELQERANGGSWAQAYSGAGLSIAMGGRLSGIYDYRVRACNADCGGWSAIVTVAVELPPDGPPTLNAPATAVDGNYTVSWSAPGGAEDYDLQERASGGNWEIVYHGAARNKAYAGKAAGSYDYQVRACNQAGCTAWSATKTVQAVYTPTTAPTLTVPATTTSGSYTVSWSAVSGATNYKLEQQLNGGAFAEVYAGAATSQAYSGVAAAVYGYRVRACNAAGCGPFSAVKSITRSPTAAPTVSTPAASLPGNYTVSWTAVTAATSYRLEEQVNGGGWAEVQNGSALSKAYAGKSSATYGYRARGCNAAGCGPYAAVKTTVVYPLSIVTAPATNDLGNYTVSWTSVTSATSYRLDEQVNSGSWTEVQNSSALGKTFTGKTNGTYRYRVRACNAEGCGGYSAVATTVVQLVSTVPAVPGGLGGTSTSLFGKITDRFWWSAAANATTYELMPSMGFVPSNTLSYVRKRNGNVAVSIAFQVRACNQNGCSAWSAVAYTEVVQ